MARSERRRFRPRLECLEDRAVPSIVWVNKNGGAWDDPNNWLDPETQVHRVPNSGDDVSFGLVDETLTVIGSQGCRNFTLGQFSHLAVNGNVNFAGDAHVGGTVGIYGATAGTYHGINVSGEAYFDKDLLIYGPSARLGLSDAHSSEINGEFSWQGGMLYGGSAASPVELNSTLTMSGSDTKVLAAHLFNHGTVTHTGTGAVDLNGGEFTNGVGAIYDLQSDAGWSAPSTQQFINQGEFRKTGGTGTTIWGGFRNIGGTLNVESGTLCLQLVGETTGLAPHINDGAAITLENRFGDTGGGRLIGSYSGTGGGQVRFESGLLRISGATFDFPEGMFRWTGGTLVTGIATLTNYGSMTFDGPEAKTLGGTIDNRGTIIHTGAGQLRVSSGSLNNLDRGLYDIRSDAGFLNNSTFVNYGTLRKSDGSGVSDLFGQLINNDGIIEVQKGTLDFTHSSTVNGGQFVVNKGAILKPPSGTYTGTLTGPALGGMVLMEHASFVVGTGGVTLDFPIGVLIWTSATISGNANTLTNVGTMSFVGSSSGAGFTLYDTRLDNRGTIYQGGTAIMYMSGGQINNSGLFQLISDATLYGSGVFYNTGTLRKSAGTGTSQISFTYGHPSENTGTIEVLSGTLYFYDGFVNNGGDVAVAAGATLSAAWTCSQTSGTIHLDGGTLRVIGAAANIQGGSFTGFGTVDGSLTNSAEVSVGSDVGTLTVVGNYTQTATGTLRMDLNGADPGTGHDQLTVNGWVTLDGSLAGTRNFPSASGDRFTLIANDGTDAITRTFAGMSEGDVILIDGSRFQIGYHGDTGNDVVLTNVQPVIDTLQNSAASVGLAGTTDIVHLSGDFQNPGLLGIQSATIDWGDGTTSPATILDNGSSGSLSGEHVYPAGGRYTITLALSDSFGECAVATSRAWITGVGVHQGVLEVIGTPQNDRVTVSQARAGRPYIVSTNLIRGAAPRFDPAGISQIFVATGDGKDRVTIGARVAIGASVDGGTGNDIIRGGAGNDLLIGGEGDDQLAGGGGRDLLIGGRGADRVMGQDGDDVLVAGFTDYDADYDAMAAILAEWTAAGAYADRVNFLRNGGALNGSNLLNASTVHDDSVRDRMWGNRNSDLFYRSFGQDVMIGLESVETVVGI